MKIFTKLEDIKDTGFTALALGNFDGVHKGHQKLLAECVAMAEELDLEPSVFTFTNHPANEIAGRTVVKNIMTFEEKAAELEAAGIENMFSIIFDENIRNLSPVDFINFLLQDKFSMRHAVCGFDYSFGYKAQGDAKLLKQCGIEMGFGVSVVAALKINGEIVSSTLIRRIIDEGRIDEYPAYTGRLYRIDGRVVEGKHLGRRLGYPTMNLSLDSDEAFPKNGVYITKTYVNHESHPSITNVGNKPTVGEFAKNAETHIFGFKGELYGRDVRIEFIKMLRPEFKFPSLEALQKQIHSDCIEAERYFEEEREK